MYQRTLLLALVAVGSSQAADEATATVIKYHNYRQAIELKRGPTRAVLCPEAGGRVLEFSVNGVNALYFEDGEKQWEAGKPGPISAGRFDYGPELVVAPHPKTWGGTWTVDAVKDGAATLVGPRDDGAIQVTRVYRLRAHGAHAVLECQQKLTNIGNETKEVCHWGRSFSPSGGICVIPLGDRPSRFPSKYAMYEDGATINVRPKDDNIRERDGCLEILAPPRKPKLGFDSYAGWLAYALPSNMMFVKRFPTYPDRVYNEAAALTLSVWSPKGAQIELEPIGPREVLKPGASASFTEEWWLLPHPFPKKGEQLDLKALRDQVLKATRDVK